MRFFVGQKKSYFLSVYLDVPIACFASKLTHFQSTSTFAINSSFGHFSLYSMQFSINSVRSIYLCQNVFIQSRFHFLPSVVYFIIHLFLHLLIYLVLQIFVLTIIVIMMMSLTSPLFEIMMISFMDFVLFCSCKNKRTCLQAELL